MGTGQCDILTDRSGNAVLDSLYLTEQNVCCFLGLEKMRQGMQKKDEELKLTYSCILTRGKEKIVRVTFEGKDAFAEGIVPDGKIEKQQGFTKEEIEQLESYLKTQEKDIMKKAKGITGLNHWF